MSSISSGVRANSVGYANQLTISLSANASCEKNRGGKRSIRPMSVRPRKNQFLASAEAAIVLTTRPSTACPFRSDPSTANI